MPYTTYVPLTDYQGKQLVPVRLHPISEPRVVGQQGTTLPQSAIPPYGQLFPPTRWFTDIVVPPIVYDEAVLFGTFPTATVGTSYVYDLFLAGGDGSWSNPRAIVGTLPTWATLSIVGSPGAYKLRLSGIPTGSATTVNVTVAADSGDGQTATSAQSFAVSTVSYTTFDAAYKGPKVVLSNADLTVESSGTSAGLTRSIKSITGKKYFEVRIDAASGAGAVIAAGICNSSELASAALGFTSANGWALWGLTGYGIRHAGVTLASTFFTVGDVAMIAVDASTGSVWFGINGVWLGSGSPNPATGTAPNYTGIAGPLYAAVCPWGVPDCKLTARFDPASFSYGAPSGFGPITA